jgi:hypothetical protein
MTTRPTCKSRMTAPASALNTVHAIDAVDAVAVVAVVAAGDAGDAGDAADAGDAGDARDATHITCDRRSCIATRFLCCELAHTFVIVKLSIINSHSSNKNEILYKRYVGYKVLSAGANPLDAYFRNIAA